MNKLPTAMKKGSFLQKYTNILPSHDKKKTLHSRLKCVTFLSHIKKNMKRA